MIETTSREMSREDLPQLLALSRDNMAEIIYQSWGVEFRDEDLLHVILEPTAYTEVVEADGRIVAYFSVDAHRGNLFVGAIQVSKDYQGKGLGRSMMARVEDIARARRMSVIELYVQLTNRPAMQFYRHLGYRTVSRQGNNYLMRKTTDGAGWRER